MVELSIHILIGERMNITNGLLNCLKHFKKSTNISQIKIHSLIKKRGLRPLGNRYRLSHSNDTYNVRLFLFDSDTDAEIYYKEFIAYSEKNPPPNAIEIMFVQIKTIYRQPFGLTFPNESTDCRPAYREWFMQAIGTCNEKLRNFQSTDHSYDKLCEYVTDFFDWTILLPASFDIRSPDAKRIFADPPGEGFKPLKTALSATSLDCQSSSHLKAPIPQGPWVGVLFDLQKCEEADYGKATVQKLIEIVGFKLLANCILHAGDLLPDCRWYCIAIHTVSVEEMKHLKAKVRIADDVRFAPKGTRIVEEDSIPITTLPRIGFFDQNGKYFGI